MLHYVSLFSANETEAILIRTLTSEAETLGHGKLLFATLHNHPASGAPWVSTTYPDDWQKHYVEKGYGTTDPIRQHVALTTRAFTWNEVTQRLPKKRAAIFHEAEEAGLMSGVAVPLHGPRGLCAAIGFASDERGHDDAGTVNALMLLSHAFFSAFALLTTPRPPPDEHLTRRELDVLHWCAEGATTAQIAENLGITVNSVEWHTRNILNKFGVANKTAAVARALRAGMIR